MSIALFLGGLFYFYSASNSSQATYNKKPSQYNFALAQNNQKNEHLQQSPNYNSNVRDHSLDHIISQLSQEDQIKYSVFTEILKAKNDNDPRLDSELSHLSLDLHRVLIETYTQLKPEDRSARGLVSYLIARDLKNIEDVEFIKKIFQETACLSLENCQQLTADQSHHSVTTETTLAYPQLAALYQIDQQIQKNPSLLNSADKRSYYEQILTQAESYTIPSVHQKARLLRQKYNL